MLNKIKLHTFGDSFTQTFKSHQSGGSAWGKRYMDYIGEVPENYTEIISNHFDFDLKNHAIGGCSNYTIFDTFLENRKNIFRSTFHFSSLLTSSQNWALHLCIDTHSPCRSPEG